MGLRHTKAKRKTQVWGENKPPEPGPKRSAHEGGQRAEKPAKPARDKSGASPGHLDTKAKRKTQFWGENKPPETVSKRSTYEGGQRAEKPAKPARGKSGASPGHLDPQR